MSCEQPCSYSLYSIYSTLWKTITQFIPGIHSGKNTYIINPQIVEFEINHYFCVLWPINSWVVFQENIGHENVWITGWCGQVPQKLLNYSLETNTFGRFGRFPVCCLLMEDCRQLVCMQPIRTGPCDICMISIITVHNYVANHNYEMLHYGAALWGDSSQLILSYRFWWSTFIRHRGGCVWLCICKFSQT